MNAVVIILLVLALVSFIVAAILAHTAPAGRLSAVTFLGLGLALWVLVPLLAALGLAVVR
jgi:hypothetical protein